MIRRTPDEPKPSHERWLVSYADFITLLFAFFVVMYSVSQVNETKYRILSQTLEATFSPSDVKQAQAQAHEQAAQLKDLSSDLAEALDELIDENKIKLSGNQDWVEVELSASLLFSSGSAQLNPEAKKVLTEVADILSPHTNAVAIDGHTDNIPIRNANFPNNWALSSARAVAVVNLLALQGVSPGRLSATGFGEYRPVVENDTEEGRGRNRRVVLKIARYAAEPSKVDINEFDAEQNTQTGDNSAADGSSATEAQDGELPASPTASPTPLPFEPVRLKGGGLLFSRDPDLPRNNPPVPTP